MDDLVLGRIGHYHDPGSGSCSAALVTHVVTAPSEDPETGIGETIVIVNLRVWQSDAEEMRRLDVRVDVPSNLNDRATFHLSRACPWGR